VQLDTQNVLTMTHDLTYISSAQIEKDYFEDEKTQEFAEKHYCRLNKRMVKAVGLEIGRR
jgi:hypothetical protein